MIGRSINQYQFTEKLGAGGMGEIYKAHDTRLNRIVAIKVLPASRSGDPERRQMAPLIRIASNLRAVLAAQVALQLMDRRVLGRRTMSSATV